MGTDKQIKFEKDLLDILKNMVIKLMEFKKLK